MSGKMRYADVTERLAHLGSAKWEVHTRARALKAEGIEVIERRIMPDELSGFSECFITGTAAEVTPVGQIGAYTFEVGDLTRRVATEYEKLVRT